MTTARRYQGGRDRDIADLILLIQNGEADLDLDIADQPNLLDIENHYWAGGFWIAVDESDAIVG